MESDMQSTSAPRYTYGVVGYFERNQRWQKPLLIASVALLVSQVGSALLVEPGQRTPPVIELAAHVGELLAEVGSIVALFAAGMFARVCDTLSARVFSFVLTGGSLAALALLAWKHFAH